MGKKFYIICGSILLLGIASGIFYLQILRPGAADIPDDIVMQTAFDNEFDFEEKPKKARLIEFMYTNCPDVCPITTLEMSQLKNKLEKEGVFGDEVEFMTITIDPKRDTLEVMEDYAHRYEIESDEEGWYFLRGDEEDTKEFADALDFLYRDPGSGEIVHSTYTYFMDEDDNLLEKFTMGEAFDQDRVMDRILRTVK
ncbi:MAG TPA: SCO family protein [Pseudogracilibacillus sp.]|nr:SCO family protein [Pseudogracilibacillus sp.]